MILFFYFVPWVFSSSTTGKIITPFEAVKVHVQYTVEGKRFYGSYLRNDIEYAQHTVSIRYLHFRPQISRINSFMGMWAEPLAWWGIFLLASAMLLLTHNTVFSRSTVFQLHKRFPWISMEEYFPFHEEEFREQRAARPPGSQGSPKNRPPLLNNDGRQI